MNVAEEATGPQGNSNAHHEKTHTAQENSGNSYRENTPRSLLPYAEAFLAAGLCVVPVKQDGSKAPGLREWKTYQKRVPTREELVDWFRPRQRGMGVVTGKVSGNVEVLEFDRHDSFDAFYATAKGVGSAGILDRMLAGYWEKSPNGDHLPYRCATIAGNTLLALRYLLNEDGSIKTDDKGKPLTKALIETRGEGGFIITAPSDGPTHESGKPYELKSGGPETIVTITPEERETLFRIARSMTEIPAEPPRDDHPKNGHAQPSGERPGDLFASQTDWPTILEPHGWVRVFEHNGTTYWRRPGKDRGISATVNHAGSGYFYCFSTSTAFEANRARGKFSAYAVLNHNSDYSAAADALMRQGDSQNGWGRTSYTNGHVPDPEDAPTEDTHGAREPEPPQSLYPCPDSLRIGVFAVVAAALGLWSWEVWLGVYGALCARAHRNLWCYYHSDHIYGNNYSLLVSPTATGKNIVINIIRALLGIYYKIRAGINSGPALVPLLTDDPLKNKEGRLEVAGIPVALLCAEWSRLSQMGGIEHSTLMEDVNDLHMRHWPWSQSRSHKNPGGGDIVITRPALTVVGTTTRSLFHATLTNRALGSGVINRYVILPGNAKFQPYLGQSYHPEKKLQGHLDQLENHTLGQGEDIGKLYSPEAWAAFLSFQKSFICPVQDNPATSEALKRLHLHLQHIAALYAWQTKSPHITLEHFEAARTVIETSHRFVSELVEERAQSFEPTKIQEVDNAMEKRALDKLRKSPGLTRREFARKLANDKGGYTAWVKVLDTLLKAGALHLKNTGKREELFEGPGDES